MGSEMCIRDRRSNAQKASTAVALSAQNSRGFRVWHDHAKGTMHFSIELPVEEGELVEQAVGKAATQLTLETGVGNSAPVGDDEQSSWAAIQSDAVVHVMRLFLTGNQHDNLANSEAESGSDASPKSSNSSADHHLVMVHVLSLIHI